LSEKRNQAFRRNEDLERLLFEINSDLYPTERALLGRYRDARMTSPLILIMGPLRSGTTLFMQWLSSLGLVAYPSNLLSRFYSAPILGAKIQLMLTDSRYNYRDELGEVLGQVNYQSENGKTKGLLAPNEFWYFWRRFFAEPQRDAWSDDELRQTMEVETLRSELNGLMSVFGKPFAAKGMLFNYNIPFLDSVFEKILFIRIERDPVSNISSVLEARRRQMGDERSWYSFMIPEYEQLKDLDPIHQAAGQIHYINRALTAGMIQVDESRKMHISYEDFCSSPKLVYDELIAKAGLEEKHYTGPRGFRARKLDNKNFAQEILVALDTFLTL
jgi:hypothetical protein